MASNNNSSNISSRSVVAYGVLIVSAFVLIALAVAAIVVDPEKDNAINIVNLFLPVISSWVGTILAFYFGRENFEAANEQVQKLVGRLTPDERASTSVKYIMRRLDIMAYFQIEQGQSEEDIKLNELRAIFKKKISRLPIIDADQKAKYIIHESIINKYLVKKKDSIEEITLAQFINEAGFEFGLNKGFVVVSEETTIAAAKEKMEKISSCQDIFVTKGGSPDEPVTGWISNLRLAKYLEV